MASVITRRAAAVPIPPRSILKVMRAKYLRGRIRALRREADILDKELEPLDAEFKEWLESRGAVVGTYRRKPVVMLEPHERSGYTVEDNEWTAVVYP